jgi:hypothetical protein
VTGYLRRMGALVAIAAAMALARPARANGYLDDWHPYQTYWAVNYDAAFPLGSLQDSWQTNPGWLGGGFDIRVGVLQRLAVGFDGTWNFFDQTFQSLTIQQPGYTFTGPVYRRLSSFTALGTVHWYVTQTTVQPFVGVGVGGAWLSANQSIVNQTTGYSTSGVAVVPEVGFLFSLGPRFGMLLSGRYQIVFTTFGQVRNPSWASAQAGFAYYY